MLEWTNQIRMFLNDNIEKRDAFICVRSIDLLPIKIKPPLFITINQSPHTRKGDHWVCVAIDESK